MTPRLQPSPLDHGHTALRRVGVPVGLAAAGHTHMTPQCREPAGAVLCAQPGRGQPRVGSVPAAGRQLLLHPGHIRPGSKPPVALEPDFPRQWCAPTVRDRPSLERAGLTRCSASWAHARMCSSCSYDGVSCMRTAQRLPSTYPLQTRQAGQRCAPLLLLLRDLPAVIRDDHSREPDMHAGYQGVAER